MIPYRSYRTTITHLGKIEMTRADSYDEALDLVQKVRFSTSYIAIYPWKISSQDGKTYLTFFTRK